MANESEYKAPSDLIKALSASPKAKAAWSDITPIARRDFITWIEGAKQEATRTRRIGIACDKLIRGDRRPCCYTVVPMNFYKALGGTPNAKATWSTLSPTERRDIVGYIEGAKDSKVKADRIEKICLALASGKKKI